MDYLSLYAASPDWIKFALVVVYHFVLTGSAFMMGTLFTPAQPPKARQQPRRVSMSPPRRTTRSTATMVTY